MNRTLSRLFRRLTARPAPQPRRHFRPELMILEDRLSPSVTSAVFTLDSTMSSLTLSGSLGGSSIQQQASGSLTTHYSGTIATSLDLGAHTISFNSSGTTATAANSGTWQPAVGGGSGSAPANYGGKVTILIITAYAAVRGLQTSLATSGALSLTGGGPNYSFPSTQTLSVTAGTADYNAGSFGSGTSSLAGNSAMNTASAGTLQDLGSGDYKLTVPIDVTINQTVSGMQASLHITGTIVGTAVTATQFAVTGPTVVTAGAANSFTVTAQDGHGTAATGYTGTVHFTSSDPLATAGSGLPADYTFTAADHGTHTFTGVTLKTEGPQTITATDTMTSSLSGTDNNLAVLAAAPDHLQFTNAPNATAGVFYAITVTVRDAYNNRVLGYTGTVHYTSSLGVSADRTFTASDMGQQTYMIRLYRVQTISITGTDTGGSGATGTTSFGVVAAPATSFQVIANSSASSGSPFDVTVVAVDNWGNVDTNYAGTVHFTTTDTATGVMVPTDYTFQPSDAGVVTFPGGVTLITPGMQTIMVTDATSTLMGSTIVTVM